MNTAAVRSNPVYLWLSDIKTSIYLLAALAFFFLLGLILPQGAAIGDYVDAGGRFALLVSVLDLLEVFTSPAFLLLSLALLANLALCAYERFRLLGSAGHSPGDFNPTHTIDLTQDSVDAHIDVRTVLREKLGFHVASKDDHRVVMEKGLPYRWLSLLYHLGFILCFVGFLLTFLFAYEETLTLRPGEPTLLEPAKRGRLLEMLGRGKGKSGFQVILDEFRSEYVESPELVYPDDKRTRLALGLGWTRPRFKTATASLAPKGWKSEVRVIESAKTVQRKTIEVGDPMRYGGYAFLQTAFDHSYKIRVGGNPILLEAEANAEVIIPGLARPLEFGSLTGGTLFKMDGGIERVVPRVKVRDADAEDLGLLELGDTLEVDGVRVTFVDFIESSILTYRFDPGMAVLWWAGIFVLVVMALRFYGSWYRAEYMLDERDGIVRLSLSISSTGVASDPDKIAERVEYHLTRDEIELTPVE